MESGVKCRLHLRIKPRHYVMNNTLPAVPLGIFNLLVFVIPTDAREKNVSCDDRVSVSWCLFVELKYSTSHWLLQNIPARGLWRIWNDFGIVIIVILRSSFQLKLHHRKSEQKRRSQSFSEVSSSLRGFYEMVLVQNVCGKSQKIWDQRKKRNESIQGRPWRRGYKWWCWWRDRSSELSSAY